jgi:hypothetical protein
MRPKSAQYPVFKPQKPWRATSAQTPATFYPTPAHYNFIYTPDSKKKKTQLKAQNLCKCVSRRGTLWRHSHTCVHMRAFTGDTQCTASARTGGSGPASQSQRERAAAGASSAVMQHLLAHPQRRRSLIAEGRKKCRTRIACVSASESECVCMHLNQPVRCRVAVFLPARTHAGCERKSQRRRAAGAQLEHQGGGGRV